MSDDVKGCAAKAAGCGDDCDSCQAGEADRRLKASLGRIGRKIVVMSGKGGVGKSTVAVNLAVALSMAGRKVGLLDVDIHGPSVPKMLGLEREPLCGHDDRLLPVTIGELKVMSIGFLLREEDDAVIWRGPAKTGVIRQFLADVEWGDLDYLVIDSPPGTGDEPLSVVQLVGGDAGAVVVTTPQEVAAADVRKSLDFCRKLNLPVLGLVENMSGFVCPKCGELTEIFSAGAGQALADRYGVRLLGRLPIDPAVCRAGDDGKPFVYHFATSATAKAFEPILAPILALTGTHPETETQTEPAIMKIALPVADGKLCLHFGHCEHFAMIEVNPEIKKIIRKQLVQAPPHEPGLLPVWMAERGINLVIAGGMGQRARELFQGKNIAVITGAPVEEPETLVLDYLAETLVTGANTCDH